jgi:hypothetical protein
MHIHAIVEIEEGALNVVVGVRAGRGARVLRAVRAPLADLGRESVARALRALPGDVLRGAAGVHVILGDRRVQHFASSVPRMPAGEMAAFVTREALRLTGQQQPDEALVAMRLARTLPGRRCTVAAAALPRAVWEPIGAACEESQFRVLGLYASETCIALAAPAKAGEPVAVLECSAGRARFVLCDGPHPVQVRRFVISGAGEANGAVLATQLAMELPRTFDWLRESGQALPKVLLLGTRVAIDDESLGMLRGEDLQRIERAQPSLAVDEETQRPSLGASMLLLALCRGAPPPSLLAGPRLVLPMGAGRPLAVASALLAGAVLSVSAVVDFQARRSLQWELAQVHAETERVQRQIAESEPPSPPVNEPAADEGLLAAALATRRPVSLLLAQVSNAATASMHLDELRFASADRIVVTGLVGGDSRREALADLAEFGRRLRQIPFLQADGQDEVAEVPGSRNRFRFKLHLAWRHP